MSDGDAPRQYKRMVEQGYDRVAHDCARLDRGDTWPRLRWLAKVLGRLAPGSAVLDIGCGSGEPAGRKIAEEHRLTGADISQTQIELARQHISAGQFNQGNVASLTLELLGRSREWLPPGGLLLFSMRRPTTTT